MSDHLGTPAAVYDGSGDRVWETRLDIYGRPLWTAGWAETMCFRYPGQYWDVETGLSYNRFRYYDAGEGFYISRDPMSFAAAFGGGLAGGDPTLYGYVGDVSKEVDFFGLACTHSASNPKELHSAIKDKWGNAMAANDMRQLQNTVDRIKTNSPKYSNDGTEFLNSSRIGNPTAQRLNTGNTYSEWTVKTPNIGNNGRRRTVVNNQTKEAFYSHDHYDSYVKIGLRGWN